MRHRLVAAAALPGVSGAGAESYIYDGLSRRQSVTDSSASTQATYFYDGLNALQVTTLNTSTNATIDLSRPYSGLGLDERFQLNGSTNGNSGTFITDIQGSTLRLEYNLTTEITYSYPPFGSTGAPSTSAITPFR